MSEFENKVREAYRQLTLRLLEEGKWITTMESCTAGQIASLITDTEGSSGVMKGAFVTYSNEAKVLQGVPAWIIETYGVYSQETAAAMAAACRKAYHADLGVGVTGSLGNVDPNNRDSVPGEVYIAVESAEHCLVVKEEITYPGTRLGAKLAVADKTQKLIQRVLDQDKENQHGIQN